MRRARLALAIAGALGAALLASAPVAAQQAARESSDSETDPHLVIALRDMCSAYVAGETANKDGPVSRHAIDSWVESGFYIDALPGNYIMKLIHEPDDDEGSSVYVSLHDNDGGRSCLVALPSGATHEQFKAAGDYYSAAGYDAEKPVSQSAGLSQIYRAPYAKFPYRPEAVTIRAIGPVALITVRQAPTKPAN